jgi:hypothetical protein
MVTIDLERANRNSCNGTARNRTMSLIDMTLSWAIGKGLSYEDVTYP